MSEQNKGQQWAPPGLLQDRSHSQSQGLGSEGLPRLEIGEQWNMRDLGFPESPCVFFQQARHCLPKTQVPQ